MKKFTALTIIALLSIACSDDSEIIKFENNSVELRFTSGIESMTRANTQSTSLEKGEKVYVWLDGSEEQIAFLKAWELTAEEPQNGINNFSGNKQYFPQSGSALDAYALHGTFDTEFAEGDTAFPGKDGVGCMVADNQTERLAYIESDLLYAIHKNINQEEANEGVKQHKLKFYHMLSKVEIALAASGGLSTEELQTATVYLVNINLNATLKPNKDADLSDEATRTAMLTVTGNKGEMKVNTSVVADGIFENADYAEAIIIPQAVQGTFIKVELQDGTVLYHNLEESTIFLSGKKYIFNITANLTELKVETTIENWAEGKAITGSATID